MPFHHSIPRACRLGVLTLLLSLSLTACSAEKASPPVPDIGPKQAREHVGKQVRATLHIRKTKKSDQTKRTYLDSELDYKDSGNLGILIENEDLPNFIKADIPEPHVHYKDQTIRVVGKPFLEDDTIFIRVNDPTQIEVVKPADRK